ncbi:MAG: metallophosphoesterase [Planctomycetia bacterium]
MPRIIQITDLHVFQTPGTLLRGVDTRGYLQKVVQHIQDTDLAFDAMIVTGDHTHDELPASYQAVRSLLSLWIDRLWQVPGNHDDRQVLRTVFADRIAGEADAPIQFAFELNNWLCLGLDTHLPGAVAGRIGADRILWARQIADRSAAARIALFCHHPPVLIGSPWMDAIGLEDRELIQDWCVSDSRVQLICCGHVHHEFSARLGNADVLTTPSTGIQFSPEGSTPQFVPGSPGYRVIDLQSDGYRTQVIRIPDVAIPENPADTK